jgi:hypothetical protein
MEEVCLLGQMEGSTWEIIMTIRSKEMECSHGLMEEDTMGNGSMENNMERGFIIRLKEILGKESGKKERECNGCKIQMMMKCRSNESLNTLYSLYF